MSPRLRTREYALLTIAGVVIVAAVAFLLIVLPQIQDVASARRAARAREQELARTTAVVTQRTAIERRHAEAIRAYRASVVRIPARPDLPGLIRALDQALATSGVDVLKIAFAGTGATVVETQSADGGALATVPFTLQVRGSYLQLRALVGAIEQLPRAVAIDRLSLTGTGAGVLADLSLRAFYAR